MARRSRAEPGAVRPPRRRWRFAAGGPRKAPRRRLATALALGLGAVLGSAGVSGLPAAAAADAAGVTVSLDRIIDEASDLGRGRFLRRVTGQRDPQLFQRPYGVAWDGDALLVTDPGAGRVLRIPKRGRVQRTPEALLQSPIGVAVCAAGTVVSDSATGKLALLDHQLRLEKWLATGLERPTGVACFGERIFVTETLRHRIVALDSAAVGAEGSFQPLTGGEAIPPVAPPWIAHALGERGDADGEFNFPTTLGLGAASLWIGDTLNFRLQRFDPVSGDFARSFGRLGDSSGEMPRVKGVGVDAGGRLWVTDAYLDQVAVYAADGAFLLSLGDRGSRPGEFSFPAGIAVHPDGRVAVADSLNRRLQIFRVTDGEGGEEGR